MQTFEIQSINLLPDRPKVPRTDDSGFWAISEAESFIVHDRHRNDVS